MFQKQYKNALYFQCTFDTINQDEVFCGPCILWTGICNGTFLLKMCRFPCLKIPGIFRFGMIRMSKGQEHFTEKLDMRNPMRKKMEMISFW